MRAICVIEDCGKPVKGRGLCQNHYARRRRGTLDVEGPRRRTWTLEERLARYVDRSGECWQWTGSIDPHGYGRTERDGKDAYAHRWMYEEMVGPIPAGFDLDHICHNMDQECPGGRSCRHRSCVNPAHLLPSTRSDNLRRGWHRTL